MTAALRTRRETDSASGARVPDPVFLDLSTACAKRERLAHNWLYTEINEFTLTFADLKDAKCPPALCAWVHLCHVRIAPEDFSEELGAYISHPACKRNRLAVHRVFAVDAGK